MAHAFNAKPLRLIDFHELLADVPELERWELVGGQLVKSMIGDTVAHALCVGNLRYELRRRLDSKRSPCRVFAVSFRAESGDDTSLFPDIMVTAEPLASGARAAREPTVLMEVLSDDPQRDRGAHRPACMTIDALRHYAVIALDEPSIEMFDRRAHDNSWRRRRLRGLEATLDLPALELTIPFAEIYVDLFA